MVSSIHVSALRLLIGPASAILLYFAARTNLYSHLFNFGPNSGDHYIILVIAFVAGFSERLVLGVVEAIAGKT
jgi:hypothetical protein